MLKRILSSLLVVVLVLVSLGGCASSSGSTPAAAPAVAPAAESSAAESKAEWPKLHYILANSNPAVDTNQMHKACVLFCEKVAEKTGGNVIIEEIPGAQLGNERDYLEGVKLGTIDLCLISNSMMTNYSNKNIFAELPFVYKDTETAFKFLDSDLWRNMLKEDVTKTLEIVPLGWYSGGFRNILNTKRPIKAPEDLSGLKIRGQENRIVVAMYQALGANCTPMPVSEVVTAVQQGTVDGCDFPLGTMISYGYPEFVKNLAMTNHLFYSFSICISSQIWNKMPPEVQAVMMEAAKEAEIEQRAWVEKQESEQLDAVRKQMDVTEIDRSAFVAKMGPVYDEFKKDIGEDFFNKAMEIVK